MAAADTAAMIILPHNGASRPAQVWGADANPIFRVWEGAKFSDVARDVLLQ
jgi:hypothetical protein